MTLENIEIFKRQALRAFAQLYKSFPSATNIEHSTLLSQSESESGHEAGTILWLYNQGFIEGNLIESNPLEGSQKAGVTNARLSERSLRILQQPEQNANGVQLGEMAVSAAFGPGEATAADLLVKRLLGH